MFTGIIQGIAQVKALEHHEGLLHLIEQLPAELCYELTPGISIAHNGCCLTLTHSEGQIAHFDIMQQTLNLTNLAQIKVDDWLNIERSAKFGDEVGGHVLSGHIAGQATLINRLPRANNLRLSFQLPTALSRFIFMQGFIAVDGASLTVSSVDHDCFTVDLIPETIARTTLAQRKVGEQVNIEIDATSQAIVATVERLAMEGKLAG